MPRSKQQMNQQINNENPTDMRVRLEIDGGSPSRLDLVSRPFCARWITIGRAGAVTLGLVAAFWLSLAGNVIAQDAAAAPAEPSEKESDQPPLPAGFIAPGVIPEGASSDEEWTVKLGKDDRDQRKILTRFRTEMIRQNQIKTEEDRKLFANVVRWKLAKFTLRENLTDPEKQQEIRELRRDIFSEISTARAAGGASFDILMETLVAEIPNLFKYHFISRLNGAWLLAELNEEDTQTGTRPRRAVPYAPAAAPLLALLKQPQQLEAVRRPAVVGLSRIYSDAQIPLDVKNEIMATFLAELENGKPTNDILPSKIASELGRLGILNDNSQTPRVVDVLTKVLADQRRPYRVRCECAQALGRLPLDTTFNIPLISYQIVELASQMLVEMQQEQNALAKQAYWKTCYWELYVAFNGDTKDNIAVKQHGLSNKRNFSPPLRNSVRVAYAQVLPVVIAVLKDEPIDEGRLPAMRKWLQDSVPNNKKVHDSFQPIIGNQLPAQSADSKNAG